jgi:hypothetical protein
MMTCSKRSKLKDKIDGRSESATRLVEYDTAIRGAYLAYMITIDVIIKDIISYHFCSDEDKRKQFVSLILNGKNYYTFSFGIKILEKLLGTHYQDLTKRYPKLMNDLDIIRKYRDWLVHSILDTSHEFMAMNHTDRIRLISYDDKGQANYKEVSRSEIDERLEDCLNVHFALVDIRMEVKDRILTTNK